jgi:hypothetical protein
MPAQQLSVLKPKFLEYLDASKTSDDDFELALNEVMPRLYHMGFWRDMLTILDGVAGAGESVSNGYYDLPDEDADTGVGYDSIISAMLDDSPRAIWSVWHDFRRFGQPSSGSTETSLMGGFIDAGYTGEAASDGSLRRRYRIGGVNTSSQATFLVKRKWVHVSAPTHKAFVPNDNSIVKHALLGKLGEDNADVQRAEYHWTTAQRLLEADIDSYRGGAKPVLQISPNGAGGTVSGMY